MEREPFKHGFAVDDWERGKDQARAVMYDVAGRRSTIAYSDLVAQITAVRMEPHDPRLAHFLGQIAREDDDNGLGLTTVVVVHKHGDQQPGPGFFDMAESQGRVIRDQTMFWIEELKRVHDLHADG
jgi:hypothetical protein